MTALRRGRARWVVATVALVVGTTPSLLAQERTPSANVVAHPSDPAADVVIAAEFSFLGRVRATVMDGKATSEQYWFVRSDAGRIARMVVVHFERWKDGVEGRFDYPTFRLQRIGSHDYLHQSFPLERECALATREVRAMMQRARLRLAKECIATRFVRAASADKRSEIILFYVEPVDTLPSTEGLGLGGLPVGYDRVGAPETPWGATDRRLTREALRAIEVRDRP
ncbi:MAG TPA: hypothetical protein VFV33_00705 [Gemmatimonadaceae bacterium]|nr:hypothetical protein [Gemmatimonadaceae bacterium]